MEEEDKKEDRIRELCARREGDFDAVLLLLLLFVVVVADNDEEEEEEDEGEEKVNFVEMVLLVVEILPDDAESKDISLLAGERASDASEGEETEVGNEA